ncbi:MAG TPA: ferritin family protein [Myxococcota bacterium]
MSARTGTSTGKTTTAAWWAQTKSDAAALLEWLRDQYRGEARAAGRIEALRDAYAEAGTRAWTLLTIIASQERTHASWVAGLLAARGEIARVDDVVERYWPRVESLIHDLKSGAAVGAHAERMRLERIEEIARDLDAPSDVRAVFARILPDERFHERAFRELAGAPALADARGAHELGRLALGLTP